MPRPLSAILIIALLVAQILPLGSVARGVVLCVSLDGHVAIEPVHAAPECGDLCGDASPGEDAHEDHDEGDHGCFDLQLGDLVSPLESARAQDDGASIDMAPAVVSRPVAIALDVVAAAFHEAPTRSAGERCALRTVVLRL
jgi:hypothetical protein